MAITPVPEPVNPPIAVSPTLTVEQFENTRDSLRSWVSSIGDAGSPEAIADNGIPYTTVVIEFSADELAKAIDKFKAAVIALQGTNGCYIRTLPDLAFDGKAMYQLRVRLAPKNLPIPA